MKYAFLLLSNTSNPFFKTEPSFFFIWLRTIYIFKQTYMIMRASNRACPLILHAETTIILLYSQLCEELCMEQ
jgi:hypothetical protein